MPRNNRSMSRFTDTEVKTKLSLNILAPVAIITLGISFIVASGFLFYRSQWRTRGVVPQFETLEGSLEVTHVDRFNEGTSDYIYTLVTASGKKRLRFTERPKEHLVSRALVRVRGVMTDDDILVNPTSISVNKTLPANGLEVRAFPPTERFGGEHVQRTLVVMVYALGESQPTTPTAKEIEKVMFGGNDPSVRGFHFENSYGQMVLSGNVYDWRQIPTESTCDSTPYVIQLFDPEVDFRNYDKLVIVQTGRAGGCGRNGFASIGKHEVTTQDGVVALGFVWAQPDVLPPSNTLVHLLSHEVGHNLGLGHAYFHECGPVSIAEEGCIDRDYQDPYDVMGIINPGHMNPAFKEYLEFFQPRNLVTVDPLTMTNFAEFTLEPYSMPTAGPKVLKVKRGPREEYLYLAYRPDLGYDAGFTGRSDLYSGLNVHLMYGLIDANVPRGEQPSNWYAALPAGQSFVDPYSGVKIEIVSLTTRSDPRGSGLTMRISPGKTDFTPPTVTITAPTGGTVSGLVPISAEASDEESGIEKVEFFYKHYCLTDGEVLIGTDHDPPFESVWDTTRVFVHPTMGGQYSIIARAYDGSGVPFSALGNSQAAEVNVTVRNAVPTVTISSPRNGERISGPASFTISLPAGKVEMVLFFIRRAGSRELIGWSETAPYGIVWDSTKVPNGSYNFYAVVRTCALGIFTPEITLTVDNGAG